MKDTKFGYEKFYLDAVCISVLKFSRGLRDVFSVFIP